jgi:hypothetical protein
MSFDAINNRFQNAVHVVNASCTQLTVDDAAAAEIYGSKVTLLPGEAADGLTFRWSLAGTKTGTNEAHVVNLMSSLSDTPLLTLTADDTSAVDWTATIIMRIYGGALQKIMGFMSGNTTDCECDYAAGTASLKDGAKLFLTLDGHTSDSVTAEMCVVESWVM